jgi:hypothetical protein
MTDQHRATPELGDRPTTTDFRALCAELLDALENAIGVIYGAGGTKHISTADAVIIKADAALAQPEPQEEAGEEADWLHDHALSCRELGRNDWAAQSTRAATLLQQLSAIEDLKND